MPKTLNSLILYSEENLAHVFNYFGFHSVDEIKTEFYFDYFTEYLGKRSGLGATHYILEKDYVSKDFIDDYSDFYSLCYHPYEKKCVRIHFYKDWDNANFKKEFDEIIPLSQNKDEFFNKYYLGYVVIKPIPTSIIGRSLLRTYNYNEKSITFDSQRNYWAIRDYKVHIFGNDFTIKSLAFQQQDAVLSACATVSIWVVLQRACLDYFIPLKTPGKILLMMQVLHPMMEED